VHVEAGAGDDDQRHGRGQRGARVLALALAEARGGLRAESIQLRPALVAAADVPLEERPLGQGNLAGHHVGKRTASVLTDHLALDRASLHGPIFHAERCAVKPRGSR
jgi:hypothetical protein